MESKVKIFGHPVHPILIVFPLGLLATSVIFDLIGLAGGPSVFHEASFWMIAAGIVGGLSAAIFGLIDWLAIPKGTRAKGVGLMHGVGNVIVVGLFALSWLLRIDVAAAPGTIPIVLSLVGAGLATVTGWLGGELVDRLGVGVDAGANLNASNSLSEGIVHVTRGHPRRV